MENKYYTPSIEEFYVGFEYQFNDIVTDDEILGDWTNAVIKDGTQIDDITKGNYSLRVKLLDREDIESLGWEYFKKYNRYYKGDIELEVCDDNTISIHTPGDYDNEKPHFSGTIKNKSELKKIMQQLNIK